MHNVLITGGSGYFGRAFVARLLDDHPNVERICIYSRGEHAQAKMREDFGMLDGGRLRFFIGDVRDSDRLELAMHGVDTVIHAAALKRVEACEWNPMEAVCTNVIGSQNVINSAIRANVPRVVALSTDKACEPTTLYGTTKLTAERMFLASNHLARTKFVVTRYGNVAGSTGSVIPKWRNGGAHTISDPECTRFWMTADQAVDLVLAATTTEKTFLTPDLPAYRLSDLAGAMDIVWQRMLVTGLPPSEKRHERLIEGGPTSAEVRRMSVDELREALKYV
jgi:UDP-N-acetylglucosamine 4,6-dehydratase